MSLYNMLFGINEDTDTLLKILNVNKEDFNRFRDIELTNNGTILRVFTRCGGYNRNEYKVYWNKIRKHPLYLKDYDDTFDNTYAYIEFKVPQEYKEKTRKMFKEEPKPFEEKFKKELVEMEIPGTKAYEKSQMLANKILDAIKNGERIQIIKL